MTPRKDHLHEFTALLKGVDEDIANGFFLRAEDKLLRGAALPESPGEMLRLLKRGYKLLPYEGKEAFYRLTESAYTKYPRHEDIAFLAARNALEEENYSRAKTILEKAKRSSPLNRLRLELALRLGERENLPEFPPDSKYTLVKKLRGSTDMVLFKNRGIELNNGDLLLNAALLHMRAGEPEEALKISREYLGDSKYDEAALYLAMDNGDLDLAMARLKGLLERYERNPVYPLLAGDIFFRRGEYGEAKYSYLRSLNADPAYSPTVYLNLNWIYRHERNEESAELFLSRGLKNFPANSYLILEMGKLLKSLDRFQEARILVTGYLDEREGDADLNLFLLALNRKAYSPEAFYIELWDLFNRFRENPGVCHALVSLLLKAGNQGEAALAMDVFSSHSGISKNWWLLHFQGLLSAVTGKLEEGMTLLTESLELKEDLQVRYNLGLIRLEGKRYREAIEDFKKILAVEEVASEPEFYSLVLLKAGESYLYMREMVEARRLIRMAVEADSGNMRARLLLKQVE